MVFQLPLGLLFKLRMLVGAKLLDDVTPSDDSRSGPFTSTAQNFAINCINRRLCTIFADPDGALGSSIHLYQ